MSSTSTIKPGKRGRAGDVGSTSPTAAGPACAPERVTRFTFAIRLAKSSSLKAKLATAVAEHLDDVPGAVILDEWADAGRLFVSVAVWPPLRADDARRVAETCPEYLTGTVELGR